MRSGPAIAALLLALVTACDRPPAAPPAVAHVDEDAILASALKLELDRVRTEAGGEVRLEGEKFADLRRAVLRDLIDRHLLLAAAARDGITVTEAEVESAIGHRQADAPEGEPLRGALSATDLRVRTREQLVVDRFLLKEVVARVALGPDDARKYYELHIEEFAAGEEVRASQILVPTREEADALRVELIRSGDFAKMARQHSSSPDARLGGDLGWFGKGQMPPEFDAVCFALKKGQISDTVQTPYGFHLFRVADRRDRGVRPFAAVERDVELRLRRDAVARMQTVLLERLRQKSTIQIVDVEVDKVL